MEILIEKVKNYPYLWNNNSRSYKGKEDTWGTISRECGFANAQEAKFQWKRLRDSHREAMRRRKNSINQAANNNRPWKYEKLMEFLLPQSETEPPAHYTDPDEESIVQITSLEDTLEDDVVQTQIPTIIKKPANKDFADILDQRERRRDQRQNERDELKRQSLDSNRFIHQQDAMMNLFISMCEKTKALPKFLQLRVQREVFESVTRAEEEALSLDGNQYSYRSVSGSPYAQSSSTYQYSDETNMPTQSPQQKSVAQPQYIVKSSPRNYDD